jgi:two-component system cell cycle response regulator CpdR
MAHILVAEDEEPLRQMVARGLRDAGHGVTAVGDGAAAVDAMARGPFDLVLADIRMPVMDGIALALIVARDYPDSRILLMTGYADLRERAHGLESLIQGVLAKPFTLAELQARVADALAPASGR